jgi:flagellar biosynthesis chaperone FliJ
MAPHEEFLKLCAAATANELTPDERAKLDAHLERCAECQRTMKEYEVAAQHTAALAAKFAPEQNESDHSWSVEEAEKSFFERLKDENKSPRAAEESHCETAKRGQRFGYRPSHIHWREVWMSLAAVVFLALALAITANRTGVKRGTDSARPTNETAKDSTSLEEQASDAGHERAQLLAKLAEEDRMIAELERRLSGQQAVIAALKAKHAAGRQPANSQEITQPSSEVALQRDQELATAQAKLIELQKTIDTLAGQRDEIASHAAVLEAKVGDLTQVVRDRERELDQKENQVAKDQDLLEHDRDIRELIGARDLYIAEIHDVSGNGETNKTYGRIFYTRGKRLVFYAYDLDAQHSVQQASSFQAWGRRGPNKEQALNLGVFYEDNASKKRWVLRADNPKSLEDIDAVFVTIEPNGGSQHPSGKQLLFAYLRINPNHP